MATLSMFSGIIIKKYWACLKSPAYFRQVKAEYGMLCWPNDIDIDHIKTKAEREACLNAAFEDGDACLQVL